MNVWDDAWISERGKWTQDRDIDNRLDLIRLTMNTTGYSVWREISDTYQKYMKRCELIV